MSSFKFFIDAVLPHRCPISGEIVDSQGMVAPEAWKELAFIAPPLCQCCGLPFEFSIPDGGESACVNCLTLPPEFSIARSALTYNDISRNLILGFKHGDQTQNVVAMVPMLKRAGADIWARAPDLIVPVPLHRWRLLRRRYNQAAIMGRGIAREMKISFIPDVLQRIRATPTQGHLNAKDRHANVKSAFSIHPKHTASVTGKKIVLVDDVYTTGATVKECVKVLNSAGAEEVYVLTLARVVRAGKFD